MHAQRQLAGAAVRAEVRRHEVAKQSLCRLRKLAERVGDPELRNSIQASLDRLHGKRRVSSQLGCIGDPRGEGGRGMVCSIEGLAVSYITSQSATS